MPNTYSLLDFGLGKRLERWGQFTLIRPDPTAVGLPAHSGWVADAEYVGEKGKGEWKKKIELPAQWVVDFADVKMTVKLAPYKHTGVFPEQMQNWKWMREQAKKKGRPLNILNLFAYTGGATMALAKDGHFVTHVDASKPAITWAKENAELNTIPADRIRWMLEDAPVFAARELKRGKKYDAILLDPPAFGHSPTGKVWRNERDLAPLLETCAELFSDDASFLLLNGYAQHDSPESFARLLKGILHAKGATNFTVDTRQLVLKAKNEEVLSTGIVARCGF